MLQVGHLLSEPLVRCTEAALERIAVLPAQRVNFADIEVAAAHSLELAVIEFQSSSVPYNGTDGFCEGPDTHLLSCADVDDLRAAVAAHEMEACAGTVFDVEEVSRRKTVAPDIDGGRV